MEGKGGRDQVPKRAMFITASCAILVACVGCAPSSSSGNSTSNSTSVVAQAIKTELNLLQNNGDTVDEIISDLEEDFPDAVDAVIQIVAAAFGS